MSLPEQLSLFWASLGGKSATPQRTSRPTQTEYPIQLGTHVLSYRLRRGVRRRLTMTIDAHGLRVGAALTLSLSEVEAFIHHHADWVLEKLAAQAAAPKPPRVSIDDGIRLPLLDREATVRVLPGHNRCRWIGDTLLLEARPRASLPRLTERGLQQRALEHFTQRLNHYAPQLGISALPPLGLSSARTRWGSCSRLSGIRLNWRLIHLPAHLGDYVVVHELAHLHEMNHSPRFWRVVETVYPNWRQARDALKQHAQHLPVLSDSA
jgi:predicted metal-dependent hydrolase